MNKMKIKWYYPILPCIIGCASWAWYILISLEPRHGIIGIFCLLWWKTENIQLQIKELKEMRNED